MAAVTHRKRREHTLNGKLVRDSGGATVKICDSAFLAAVARYMADSGKRYRIHDYASTPGQYDMFQLPPAL